MTEIRDNNFSKLCEGKGELLSKALRDRILEQDFMRKSKFPIIYASIQNNCMVKAKRALFCQKSSKRCSFFTMYDKIGDNENDICERRSRSL